MSHSGPELLHNAGARLGEGAIWDSRRQRLLWIDIEMRLLHEFDPVTGRNVSLDLGQMVGTVAPRRVGGVVLALHHGLGCLPPDSRRPEIWCDPEAHLPTRFNDGKCDPAGRLWAGTLGVDKHSGNPIGALYRLDADRRAHRMIEGIACSNGIAWSHDSKRMYYIDTPTLRIDLFDFDLPSGAIAHRRPLCAFDTGVGYPDGMTIDAAGDLWVAFWDGSCVRKIDGGTGRVLATLDLPVTRVTSVALGGPDLRDLFITTAHTGLSDEQRRKQPHAGSLFVTRVDTPGVPAFEFAG